MKEELSNYSALDFILWLMESHAQVPNFVIAEVTGDIVTYLDIDIDTMVDLFLSTKNQYEVIIRGNQLIITDKIMHTDKISREYTEENKDEVQMYMDMMCELLNKKQMTIE